METATPACYSSHTLFLSGQCYFSKLNQYFAFSNADNRDSQRLHPPGRIWHWLP